MCICVLSCAYHHLLQYEYLCLDVCITIYCSMCISVFLCLLQFSAVCVSVFSCAYYHLLQYVSRYLIVCTETYCSMCLHA